jgi:hypothetical protein
MCECQPLLILPSPQFTAQTIDARITLFSSRTSMRRWLIATAISLGVVLRLLGYFRNRSLWFDEAALAINIIGRPNIDHPLWALFRPLEFHQGAPIGFLLIEKFATRVLGPGELALRLFPLICGLLTVLLVANVGRLYLSSRALPLANALVALNPSLISYSSEAKQYSSDALVTLLLLLAFARLAKSDLGERNMGRQEMGAGKMNAGKMAAYALIGALAVWFSAPAVFLLASAAIVFLWSARADRSRIVRLTPIFTVWAVSFAVLYVVSLRPLENDAVLLNFWAQYFPPRPLGNFHVLSWLFDAFSISFRDPAGLAIIPAMVFFVAGCAALFRRHQTLAWIVLGSCLALVFAAFAHKYPLGSRLLIFAVPIMLLLVAEGVAAVCARLPHGKLVYVAVGCFVLSQPALNAVRSLVGTQRDDIRPVIEYAETHARPSDVWYVYFQGRPQMLYYSQVLGLNGKGLSVNWKLGSDCENDAACYARDVNSLAGSSRAWIILSHVIVRDNTDDRTILLEQFDAKGRRLQEFTSHTAWAYLYELSSPDSKSP